MLAEGGSAPSGYGRELSEHALPYQLGAKATYTDLPDGIRCTINTPVSTAMPDA